MFLVSFDTCFKLVVIARRWRRTNVCLIGNYHVLFWLDALQQFFL